MDTALAWYHRGDLGPIVCVQSGLVGEVRKGSWEEGGEGGGQLQRASTGADPPHAVLSSHMVSSSNIAWM